jgi:hypothetical protein
LPCTGGTTIRTPSGGTGGSSRKSVRSSPGQPIPWEQFLRTSGNPLVPTFGDALDRSLSQQEAAEFTSYLRPLVETGAGLERRAAAYLTAVKE